MDNITIDANTTISSSVITTEEMICHVEIKAEVENFSSEIEVINIEEKSLIDVETKEMTFVTIEAQRGVLKLYSSFGQNVDGAVDQKTITEKNNLKVDKISGYSLTQNNLSNSLKNTYDSIVNWISTNGNTLINHLSNTSNPHTITKEQIGLSDVPNTDFTSVVALNSAKETNVSHPIVEKSVPFDAIFTDTIYDDTEILENVSLNTNNKVDKIEDHELISLASLIHRTSMSIRQDDMNMKLILK
jgi:hypothetical protein